MLASEIYANILRKLLRDDRQKAQPVDVPSSSEVVERSLAKDGLLTREELAELQKTDDLRAQSTFAEVDKSDNKKKASEDAGRSKIPSASGNKQPTVKQKTRITDHAEDMLSVFDDYDPRLDSAAGRTDLLVKRMQEPHAF